MNTLEQALKQHRGGASAWGLTGKEIEEEGGGKGGEEERRESEAIRIKDISIHVACMIHTRFHDTDEMVWR